MVCALSNDQIKRLFKKVTKDLFTMIEEGKPLNVKDYIKSIYKGVNDVTKDSALAQTYASIIPQNIILARYVDADIKKFIPATQIAELAALEDRFQDFDQITEYLGLSKPVTPKVIASTPEELETQDNKHASKVIPSVSSAFFSARPDTYFATLGNEEDPKMAFSYGFIRNLIENTNVYSDETNYYLTAMLARNAIRESDDYPSFTYDKNFVLNVITNSDGEVLYFDNNFNQTTPENGKPVAFYFRNKVNQVQSAGEIERHSADKLKSGTAEKYLKDQQEKVDKIIKYVSEGRNRKVISKIINAKTGFIDVKYNTPHKIADLKIYIQDPVIKVFNTQKEKDLTGKERYQQVYAISGTDDKAHFKHNIIFNTLEVNDINNGEFIDDMLNILLGDSKSLLTFDKKTPTDEDIIAYKKDILATFFGNNFLHKSRFFVETNQGQVIDNEGYALSKDELKEFLTKFKGKDGKTLNSKLHVLQNYGNGVVWYEKITKDGITKYSIKPAGIEGSLTATEYVRFILNNSTTPSQPNAYGEIKPMHPYLVFETEMNQIDKIEDTEEEEEVFEPTSKPTVVETSIISDRDNPIKIYSDGSDIKGTGRVGFGAVYEHQGKEYTLSGTEEGQDVKELQELFPDAEFSNPTMEMLALVKVLESFQDSKEHLSIFQDYKGAVNYNELWNYSEGSAQREAKPWKAKKNYIIYLVNRAVAAIKKIEENGGSVKINWVKGHAGNKMNERADYFAKSRDNANNLTEPLRVDQPSTQPTAQPSAQPLGKIKLNIIEDWVQKGQATTTVRNSSYHKSFYKGDGVYISDKGNLVNITYKGVIKLEGNNVVGDNISYTKDEFAKAEGFGTWDNFVKNAKYAGQTLVKGGSVHLYEIKPTTQPTVKVEEVIEPTPSLQELEKRIKDLESDLEDKYRRLDELELDAELNKDLSNPYLYIVDNLPKITPESARKETGTKIGTSKDINPSFLSKSGVSVEKAAELIAADGRNEGVLLEEDFIRNEIIEILQIGKKEYKKRAGLVDKADIREIKKEIDELNSKLNDALAEVEKISSKSISEKPSAKTIEEYSINIEEFDEPEDGNIDDLKNKFKKSKVELQKLANTLVSEEKLTQAFKWYSTYKVTVYNKDGSTSEKLLKDIVPFVALFNRINSENPKEIANFTNAGITLFKGSDYSDLYHEAFHVFLELFLSAEEKQKIFNSVRKLSGSFVDHAGNKIKFELADDIQIEEYLAEEFREYMLADGKKGVKKAIAAKSFFAKLLDFLKALFNINVEEGLLNYEGSSVLNDLFYNLRVGNINTLKYGYENRTFDKKTKISALVDDLQNVLDEIPYSLQSEIVDSIDSIFSEAADKLDIVYDSEQTGRKATSQIASNLESRAYVYSKYVLKRFIQQQKKFASELREMTKDDPNYINTYNRYKALTTVIKNFSHSTVLKGTTADITVDDIMQAQKDGKGLIAYHMQKSKYLTYEERFDIIDPEEQSKIPGGEYSKKSGNEISAKDLASKEVLYLISSLFKYENGKVVKNGFGFNELENFDTAWNRLAKLLEGSKNGEEIENRLVSASNDPKNANKEFFAQVLNKLGSLNSFPDGVTPILSQVNLWTKFIQVYTLDRVPLIQVTIKMSTSTDSVDVNVGSAVRETDHIKRAWENRFTSPADNNRYIKKFPVGTATAGDIKRGGTYLDSKKVLDDFKDTHKTDPIRFLNAIGMNVSDIVEIRNQLLSESGPVAGFTRNIYNSIKKSFTEDKGIFKIADIVGTEETGRYNTLLALESKYSDVYGSNIVSNAKGDAQYEMMLRSTISKMISILNEANSYSELIGKNSSGEYNYPEMSHLDYERNPGVKNLDILKTLFGDKFWQGEGKKVITPTLTSGLKKPIISLLNSAGVALTKDDYHILGQSSIESDETTNVLQNFYMSIMYGVSHSTQHSDKSSTYLYRMFFPSGKRHFINIDAFKSNTGKGLFRQKLMGYLSSEISRMFLLRNGDPSGKAIVGDTTYKEAGSDFVVFEDILVGPSPRNKKISLKDELIKNFLSKDNFLNEIAKDENTDIRDAIEQNIDNYLNIQVSDFTEDILKTGADKNVKLMKAITGENYISEKLNQVYFTAYVANDWIQKYETTNLFYGDVALYNIIKEELHKRNAGIAATGTFPRTDSVMLNLLNGYYSDRYKNSDVFKTEAFELTDYAKNRKRGKTFNSAVLEDTKVKSLFVDSYRKIAVQSEKQRFKNLNKEFTKADQERIESQYDEYDKMKIGDAQGWITFDAYRALLFSMGKWSQYQEDLYNAIIDGKQVDTADVLQFFPIKKMQYWGTLAEKLGLPLYAFHKFSLVPLIPTLVKNTHLETLHNRMVSQGIDYATFQTGSKINSITKDGKADKFYNNPADPSQGVAFESNDYTFTRNEVFLEFFKDQLETADVYKNNVIFSTQLRKLIEEGLYENGKPVSFKGTRYEWDALPEKQKVKYSEYVKVKNYEKLVRQLTEYKIKELEKETDFTYDPKTNKYNLTQKFVDYIKKQLTVQDLAEHEIDFIKYDSGGSLVYDLSIHPSAEKIERLLAALVYKKIVRQKVNGEPLIQVSGAGFEPSGLRSASEEERKKYGQDGLSFYEYNKKGTIAMQGKIALQGDFKKLLKLPEVKEKIKIAKKLGRDIDELQALNELIKTSAWLEENKQLITIAGVRIPVQGLNSMEFIQIAEFLPENSGNMIILPREIVAKSGSDFDIDKMSLMFPSLLKTSKGVSLVKYDPKVNIDINSTQERIKELYRQLDIANDQVNQFTKDYFASVPSEDKTEFLNLMREYKLEIHRINFEIYGQLEIGEQFPEALYDDLYSYQEKIIELLDTQTKPIKDYKERTIGVLIDEIDSLKTSLAAASSKGIENDLLFSVVDILSMPQNFVDLITPNGTYLLKPLSEELSEDVRDYNPFDTISGESYTYDKGDKKVKRVSGTRMFELRYNRYKQQSNNIGKKTLGMGAVDNTYNTIFNRVGAYLSHSVELGLKKRYTVYQRIKGMKHNVILDPDGNEVISLSNLYDANNENKISTVISQMINGWVDVAKDAWIFDIQGNPEIASTLLFMIQAGVPVKQAVYFVSQPVIRDYIKKQRSIRGVFAQPLNLPSAGTINFRTEARRQLISQLFKIDPKNIDLSNMLLKRTIYTKLIPDNLPANPDFSEQTLRENIKKNKSTGYTETDKQVFLHFLELEEMAKATTKVKLGLNFDTDKLSSLYEINDKIKKYRSLREEDRIPYSVIEDIVNESPIGSFLYNKRLLGLISSLFPTRDDEDLNMLIDFEFADVSEDEVLDKYGMSFSKKEKLIGTFINDFTGYILQQYLYNPNRFNPNSPYKGTDVSTDIEVVSAKKLTRGAFVIDNKLYVSNKTINSDFKNENFDILKNTYVDRGLAPVPSIFFANYNVKTSKMLFTKYVYEREILRQAYPFEQYKETKDYEHRLKNLKEENVYTDPEIFAYEEFLRDTALLNTLNLNFMFRSNTGFAKQIEAISAKYPELQEKYTVLNSLYPTQFAGVVNLKMRELLLDSKQAAIYNEQIELLSDPHTKKVENEIDNQIITKLFSLLPLFSVVQSGQSTKGSYSLARIVDQTKLAPLMSDAISWRNSLDDESKGLFINEYLTQFNSMYKNFSEDDNAPDGIDISSEEFSSNIKPRIKAYNNYFDSELDEKDDFIKTSDYDRNIKLYSTKVPLETFVKNVKKTEGVKFVVESTIESYSDMNRSFAQQKGKPALYNSTIIRDMVENKQITPDKISPIVTKKIGFVVLSDDLITDATYDSNVKRIDEWIDKIVKDSEDGNVLIFNENGYGNTYLGYGLSEIRTESNRISTAPAPETFVYLSKKLYEKFGYINPGYEEASKIVASGKSLEEKIFATEVATDDVVREKLKECFKSLEL